MMLNLILLFGFDFDVDANVDSGFEIDVEYDAAVDVVSFGLGC